ncbi:MAG: FKBP-type peptidyl-prolyl cis-trans isomerase [Mucilaginibacter sp.]
MRQKLFTILLALGVIGLMSCRRDSNMPDIKTYDQQQIQSYIAANGITGMQKDTSGQDTTGIWYKIINKGSGTPIDYTDGISYVYTLRSFDGKYILDDTVINHFQGYLGHVAPNGLMLALHNDAIYPGTKIRILVPSHLAYGRNGVGTGSSSITNGHVNGNQCLDYTINIVNNQALYDQMVIQNYITANNLTCYIPYTDPSTQLTMYYKITKAPTGANNININSDVTMNYTGQLMDNTFFDNTYATNTATFADISQLTSGFKDGLLLLGKGGGSISMLIPSGLAYGLSGSSGANESIPSNACLRFEVTVTDITNF